MARKLPKLDHVKYVHRRGRVYAYFNTGQKRDGKAIYARLPDPGAIGFFDSYAAFCAGRKKRAAKEYTVADLAHQYLKSATFDRLADNTKALYRNQTAKIVETWGKYPVNRLEPFDIRVVLESGQWGAGTCNMVRAVLGVLYRWGRQNDKAAIDPVKDIARVKTGEHDPWPEDILESALASDDRLVRLAVHLLYFTGQRIGDVMALRWGNLRDDHIYVRQTKTGKIVEPPLMAELRAELDRTPRTGLQIVHGVTESHVRRRLQAFTLAHGAKTVPHGLRKNAVNALLEAGCTIAEVSAITGQTHQIVEQYAAKVNRRKMGKAAIVKFERARKTSA